MEPNSTKLPESIIIGGISYKISETPELATLVSTVGAIERKKLYTKFEEIQNKVAQLSNVEVTPSAPESTSNIKALIAEALSEHPLLMKLSTVMDENRQDSISSYREQLLRKYEGNCIPELIEGETKEQLDASARKSVELFAKYNPNTPASTAYEGDPTLQAQAIETSSEAAAPVQPAFTPQIPNVGMPPVIESNLTAVKNMSHEEFARNRSQLMQELKGLGYEK